MNMKYCQRQFKKERERKEMFPQVETKGSIVAESFAIGKMGVVWKELTGVAGKCPPDFILCE